ncbi:MAG: LamG domain-containing protein [Rhodopirellula sp.]|nr:LamG domain-containing protein [Rhodopirellula sp.]
MAPASVERTSRILAGLFIFVLSSAATIATAAGEPTSHDAPIYTRADSLQQTLLLTRARYEAWLGQQPDARQAATFDPWLATSPLPAAEADKLVQPAEVIDLQREQPGGRPIWSPRADLIDGKPVHFVGGSGETVAYLVRTIHAERPVTLTIGIGGGDRLDMWLNQRKVASAETHLTSGRYGCAYRVDGTRVDQVLVDLHLDAGENTLLVRLIPGHESSFYFSPSPLPVPRLWERIRRDFPPDQNPLLNLVHADWFAAEGWFAADHSKLEQQCIDRLAGECGNEEADIRAALNQLKQEAAAKDDCRWLDLCIKSSVLAALRGDLDRLRAAVTELGREYPDDYPAAELIARLDDYDKRLSTQAHEKLDPADEATRLLMAEIPAMRGEMLVDRNPLLRDAEILFVKRHTYDSKHYYDDFQHISRFGGNLCVLSLADGSVREIAAELAGGLFDRYDLSFDAQRILFGYRRPKPEGFRIWEVGVDGAGLRQVTHPPDDEDERIARYGQTSLGDSFYASTGYHFWTDDVHPCYLPDGAIAFASTRCEHGVLCTPLHYLACTNLFRIESEGSRLRPLSRGALSEFTPTLMEDGRILYNRWEYVYKGIAAVQSLWTIRPDGSGGEEFYGDNVANPGVLWQARQIPGDPRRAVAIGCGHEPFGIGPVLLLDLNRNKRTPDPIISLTPQVKTEGIRGLYQFRNGVWREDLYGPFFADPYPLSGKFFLVSCNPDRRYNDPAAYAIHLLDVFGNRVPIYRDPEISSWQPMLLSPRQQPPVLPAASTTSNPLVASRDGDATATVFLSDVYRGLEGVEAGTVKYLRVLEQIPKPWSAEIDPLRGKDRGADGFGGHIAISHNAHIWVVVLRGIVPVGEDGSACFQVPAGRNLFFQALDKDYMEVQRMRTFVSFEPGESRSCIGCHERRTQAPVSRLVSALSRPPLPLEPQPGETAPRPLYYPTDVQPTLDRHCVTCHNGEPLAAAQGAGATKPQGEATSAEPDLRGDPTTLFNRSYENIFKAGLIDTIREWAGADYSMQNAEATGPYAHGSHRSKLIDVLRAGHYDVQLSREEWIKLVTWIDCGAPYYGSYFGRRNLVYRGQPDFRPVPTIESACGIPPAFPELKPPDPLPAELLAWWPLQDKDEPIVGDTSGNGHDGRAVNVRWESDGDVGRGLTLAGNGYVSADGLEEQEAVSISLWVNPASLPNQWNPLLFSDSGERGAFHFSLADSGTPNVAINSAPQQWTHRRAATPLAIGQWHHVVVTCDPRYAGNIRFYRDGQLDARLHLGLGLPLDLRSVRLGAWKGWEKNPRAGFHGQLDEVRIYRGVLNDQQVADLFAAGRN